MTRNAMWKPWDPDKVRKLGLKEGMKRHAIPKPATADKLASDFAKAYIGQGNQSAAEIASARAALAAEYRSALMEGAQRDLDLYNKVSRRLTVPNPSSPSGLRPAEMITDRAKRYRANANPPPGPRRCNYCNSKSNHVDIDHIDGNEENGESENLIYACRACNTSKGLLFAKHKIGKRARRYNPYVSAKRGASGVAEWAWAAEIVTGKLSATSPDEIHRAASLIHYTPAADRTRFAKQIWSRRRAHGTATREAVPF